jgi:D-alanyl-D-alanine carboxypeptidase
MNIKKITTVNIIFAVLFALSTITARFAVKKNPVTPAVVGADFKVSTKNDDGCLFIIDKTHPLPADYNPVLEEFDDGKFLDTRAAGFAKKMLADAKKDGIILTVSSAYRSAALQQKNFDDYVKRLQDEGFSFTEAYAETSAQIQLPMYSEHNAGLAIDFLTPDWWENHDDVTEDFENTPQFGWLIKNAHKYGFILRYPRNKFGVVSKLQVPLPIKYEPWHFRYVGVPQASDIYNTGLSLEEYFKYYVAAGGE